jgi:thiol-disulfide isomerase/thioredoxin
MNARRCASSAGWLAGVIIAVHFASAAGTYLPPFDLPLLGGGIATERDLAGDVVLFFVLPDCSACDKATQLVGALAAEYPKLAFRGVTATSSEAVQHGFLAAGLSVPIIVDSYGLLASLCVAAKVPVVCLFSSGRMVGKLEWVFSDGDLRKSLDALAAGMPVDWPLGPDLLWQQPAPSFPRRQDPGEPDRPRDPLVPALVAFLMEDCGYCQSMLPGLYRSSEFVTVYLVAVGAADANEFSGAASERVVVFADSGWEFADLCRVSRVPTVFLLDGQGKVQWLHEGVVEALFLVAEAAAQRPR